MKRRSRTVRPGRRGDVQPRDLKVLQHIHALGVATIPQLAALEFPDASTCARRLAVLHGLRLVQVFVQNLNQPNYYTLTRHGIDHLLAMGIELDDPNARRLPKTAALDHLVTIGNVRVAVELALHDRSDLTREILLSDHELRRIAGTQSVAYIPDLLLRVRGRTGADYGFAIEVDLAQESCAFFARTKGRITGEIAASRGVLWGLPSWRPLVLAPSVPRLRHLAEALVSVGVGDLWWGSTLAEISTTGVLEPSWCSATDLAAGRVHLRPLVPLEGT